MPIVPSHMSLLVDLGAAITNPSAAYDVDIYHLSLVGIDAVTITPVAVDNVYTDGNTFVVISVSDATDSKEYNLVIDDNVLILPGSVYLNGFTENFFAVSDSPTIQTISTISDSVIDVVFAKDMNLDDLDNPANYIFDKGLSVQTVDIISQRMVRLHTSKQTSSELYTLSLL